MDLTSPPARSSAHSEQGARRRWPLIAAAAIGVLAAVALAVAVLLLSDDDNEPPKLSTGKPRIVSAAELRAYAESVPAPVYWAGERAGQRVELTQAARARVFVRYLPAGVAPGDRRAKFTTVATYPVKHAKSTMQRRARTAPGAQTRPGPGGALVVIYRRRPTSVYLAFPRSDHLVEVYAPNPRAAESLAVSGRIAPVG